MPRKKSVFTPLVLSALALFIAAGCASETPGIAPDKDPGKTIRFGYITADQLHSPAVMVMKEKRLLEEAGFNVEWHEYIAGAHAVQDMASDIIDFANCGTAPIIINHSQGLDLAVIAGSNQEGTSLVVSDSIKSVADLAGKTIATPGLGSIQDAMLTRLAMKNNINIKRTTMDISDMPDFLRKNEIDGFIAWMPHPAIAVDKKIGHELLASKDMMPNHQCCVLVTKAETLQNDRETVEAVLKVYLEAYKWFLENQEESVKMLARATGVSEAVIRGAVPSVSYSYPPYCNIESMESVTKGLIDAGRITELDEEGIHDFIADIYHPEILDAMV